MTPTAASVRLLLLRGNDDDFAALQPLAWPLLAACEQAEFGRIRAAGVRQRRILCRAWLRARLARRLRRDAADVGLVRTLSGRLELVDGPRGFFNVSQSDGVIALGFIDGDIDRMAAGDGEQPHLGVDVETRARRWTPDLAAALFGEHELAWLLERPPAQREAGFLALWALREAVLKADGRGLSLDLAQIRFQPAEAAPWRPGERGAVRPLASPLIDPSRWHCWIGQYDVCALALALNGTAPAMTPDVNVDVLDAASVAAELSTASHLAGVGAEIAVPASKPVFVHAQRL